MDYYVSFGLDSESAGTPRSSKRRKLGRTVDEVDTGGVRSFRLTNRLRRRFAPGNQASPRHLPVERQPCKRQRASCYERGYCVGYKSEWTASRGASPRASCSHRQVSSKRGAIATGGRMVATERQGNASSRSPSSPCRTVVSTRSRWTSARPPRVKADMRVRQVRRAHGDRALTSLGFSVAVHGPWSSLVKSRKNNR